MVFTRLLVSAIMVLMVLTHVTNMLPVDETNENENIDLKSENSDSNNRESNLRYVMTIQKSSIWTEIKKRALTISNQTYDNILLDKSPNNLSDQELSQLKRVCHDGLKCVAVDQLIILRQVTQTDCIKEPVRIAINKITKVLTDYTSEYDGNKYQYVAVTDIEDTEKIYSSMTVIMNDNKELCQIGPKPYSNKNSSIYEDSYNSSEDNSNKSFNGNCDNSSNKDSKNSFEDDSKEPFTIYNNGNINFGTVNTYYDTTNSTAVNAESLENTSCNDSSESLEKRSPSQISFHIVSVPEEQTIKGKDVDKINNELDKSTRDTTAQEINISDNKITEINSSDDLTNTTNDTSTRNISSSDKTNSPLTKTDSHPVEVVSFAKTDESIDKGSSIDVIDVSTNPGVSSKTDGSSVDMDIKILKMENCKDSILNDNISSVDIASVGSYNKDGVKKGYVKNGNLNNGIMKTYDINNGTINRGVINECDADGGIINIGTVNNDAANYGVVNSNENSNNESRMNINDVKQFATTMNHIYSDIYERLSKL